MKNVRTLFAAALALLAPALHAQDALITPTVIASSTSGSDFYPVGNLIDGSGLSGTPTLAALGTHAIADSSNAWVTQGIYPNDYFAGFQQPVLTCTLPGLQSVSELVIWGYGGNPNEGKSFTVTFSTDGINFSNAAIVTQPTLLGTGAARLAFPGGARLATHVKVTVTDNYFSSLDPTAGGDRVGLGELRFAGQTPPFVVTNLADSGTGSLRWALANADAIPGADTITFAPALSGQTITLTSDEITGTAIEITSDVTVDATALAGGVSISGSNARRIFFMNSGSNLTLLGLTLKDGNAGSSQGGAIYNGLGTLTLTRCTLSGNFAARGGAITSSTASITGPITSSTTLTHCTLSGNTASAFGGAVHNFAGRTTLLHCTVSGNTAPADAGSGVSSIGTVDRETVVRNSIIAGNVNSDVDFVLGFGTNTFTSQGYNLIGSGNATGDFNQTGDLINNTPLLAPLGNYGGPTKTMPPLAGSPAIDAATVVGGLTTDQRGAPLTSGLNRDIGPARDIGSVELGQMTVTTHLDENNGIGTNGISLREAIAHNAPFEAELIRFAPALSGATLPLTINDSETAITVTRAVSVDARDLALGVKIDGGLQGFLLFRINSGASLALHGLTLAGGEGFGGGAISNNGTLTLTRCTLTGNEADSGSDGGAIYNNGTATLTHCTLASNTANSGGAIYNFGPLTLTHCTLSGNTAQAGGGIENNGTLTLTNTLIAGNTATAGDTYGPDISNYDTITRVGVNLVQDLDHFSGGNATGPAHLTGPCPLAGLAYYGGPTPTMPPLPGSPAIDPTGGATTSPFPTDQRGLPRVVNGIVDIGAVEYSAASTLSATVVNTANSGPGSLRETLAAVPDGSTLTFAPVMNGANIRLSTFSNPESLGNTALNVTGSVTLDASALPGGLTLTDTGTPSPSYRAFRVAPGSSLTLRGLTVTGFSAPTGGVGGAIYNQGTLTLERCTLSGNTANTGGGGAIFNTGGTLTLAHCTLATNRAAYGGAIVNAGGAAAATLTHCTLTLNEATGTSGSSGGGAMDNYSNAALTLRNCILAGNTSATANGPDLWMENGPLTASGVNFIGNTTSSTLTANTTILTTAANGAVNLAPLRSYGGPTPTMPPLPGSPAIDAASTIAITYGTDQRGAPLPGSARDIGAVELGKTIVNTTADENNGIGNGSSVSLREALTDPALGGSELITFAPALNGETLSLSGTAGGSAINVTKPYSSVDASSLPAGLTIDDGTATTYRLLSVNLDSTLALTALSLANGGGAGFSGNGGAIYNDYGTLMLTRCTLTGNIADFGGAIHNLDSTLSLTHCTLSGNSATSGGAIYILYSTLTLTHCTLSGNSATNSGGAIANSGTLTLTNTIVAGNTAPTNPNISGSFTGTNNLTGGVPQLAPLGDYGGPTQTMPPLPGSPAIDPTGGATTSPFPTDQRGLPRVLDGNAVDGAIADIGAVEYDRTMVLTLDNTGPGSLRDTFTAAPAASTLTFAPALSGGTIPLTSEIVLNKAITLDASALPGGLTVDGVAASVTNRIFTVNSGQTVLLKALTLTGGGGGGAASNTNGGAVYNNGTLTLERCTLSGNNAPGSGGAIFNDSTRTLTLTDCTLHANTTSTGGGGAILNLGTLTANKSTLSNNTAAASGGAIQTGGGSITTLTHSTLAGNSCAADGNSGSAIRNNGSLSLTHCTLAGNTMPLNFAAGIYNEPSRTITMAHCILHGNSGSDIINNGTLNVTGTSIIGALTNISPGNSTGTVLTSNPLLAPLGHYGGPTQTMALLPSSPARNAASAGATSDQRGFPIVGPPDIGAYEAGTTNTFALWAIENVGPGAVTFGSDQENDGNQNGVEYATRTNPLAANASPFGQPARVTLAGNVPAYQFSFPYRPGATDLRYIVQRSPDLATWTEIYRADLTTGTVIELLNVIGDENVSAQTITISDPGFTLPACFWKLIVEKP